MKTNVIIESHKQLPNNVRLLANCYPPVKSMP